MVCRSVQKYYYDPRNIWISYPSVIRTFIPTNFCVLAYNKLYFFWKFLAHCGISSEALSINCVCVSSKEKSTLMIGVEVTFSDSSMSRDGKVQLQFEDIMLKGCAVI